MSRVMIFTLAVVAGIVFAVLTALVWTGTIIGHHHDGPAGLQNFKHGILFIALAVLSFVLAAASRPTAVRA